MSASPVSISPVIPAQEPSSAVKQNDNDSGSESFSQALTREISERRDAAQASAPANSTTSANTQKTTDKTAKAEEAQSTEDKDKGGEKSEPADAAANPAGMLALMLGAHQLSGKGAPADKADVPASKVIDPKASATEKTQSAKPDVIAAAAGDKKIADTQDHKKISDAVDTTASSKAKNFAEDLRDAAKDARQARGETAKADTHAAGVQAAADTRLEALQKAASEHDRSSELRATSAVTANLMSAQQAASLHAPEAAAAAPTLSPQLGTPAWDRALGQKIVWMVAGEQQSASLTLNPPDLGPLQVVLNVSNSMADATFITAQPEVRHALEQAMPKLREMMSDAGIQLGQANVNTGTPNGNHAPRDNFPAQANSAVTGTDISTDTSPQTIRTQSISTGQGLVDTFV